CVFVRSGNWEPNTYVHEMVHVGQYGALGPEGFISAYFGSSAVVILERWVRGQPTDPITASPLETTAYAIGNRFDPAHARCKAVSADTVLGCAGPLPDENGGGASRWYGRC